jgi:hypothetical protein
MLVEFFASKPREELLGFIFHLGQRASASRGISTPSAMDQFIIRSVGEALRATETRAA